MKASLLVLIAALCLLTAPLSVSAADLCVAVLDYNTAPSAEEIKQAVAGLDVARLAESSTVKSRQKTLNGGDVLYFSRVPASTGRQVTRLGVQKAELNYSVKGGTITAQVNFSIGTKLPGGQTGSFSNAGSATAERGQAVLLDSKSRETENTMRTHGTRRTIRGKSTRIMVAQIVP